MALQTLTAFHDRGFNDQMITQLQGQVAHAQAQLPPDVFTDIFNSSETIETLEPEHRKLRRELVALHLKFRTIKDRYEYSGNRYVTDRRREFEEQKQHQDQIIQSLTQILSELSTQIKRYEDQYGPLE